jgi:hypothetical protein
MFEEEYIKFHQSEDSRRNRLIIRLAISDHIFVLRAALSCDTDLIMKSKIFLLIILFTSLSFADQDGSCEKNSQV